MYRMWRNRVAKYVWKYALAFANASRDKRCMRAALHQEAFLNSPLRRRPSLPLFLPRFQNSKDNEAVEKVMNDLDANNDGEVDFTEFIILMGALTVACNDFFLEFKTDDKPKEQGN